LFREVVVGSCRSWILSIMIEHWQDWQQLLKTLARLLMLNLCIMFVLNSDTWVLKMLWMWFNVILFDVGSCRSLFFTFSKDLVDLVSYHILLPWDLINPGSWKLILSWDLVDLGSLFCPWHMSARKCILLNLILFNWPFSWSFYSILWAFFSVFL
jgi:hypothetical protein